jgi:hypothetical protein
MKCCEDEVVETETEAVRYQEMPISPQFAGLLEPMRDLPVGRRYRIHPAWHMERTLVQVPYPLPLAPGWVYESENLGWRLASCEDCRWQNGHADRVEG